MSLSKLGNSIAGVKSIFAIFKEIDGLGRDEALWGNGAAAIKKIFDSLGAENAVKALRNLRIEGKDLIHILSECGIQTEGVEAALQKTSLTGIKFTDRMKSGLDGLAATLGMSSKTLLGWIGGITAAVTIFTLVSRYIEKTKQHLLDCVNAADAAAESWNTQNTALESQITRIQELDAKLQLGNLTEEESYAVKSELYSIQQDLVAAYGDQANAIDLVNGKLSQEIEKVKALTAAEAQRQWNENHEGNQEAAKQMEEERTFDLGSHIVMRDSAVDKALTSILNKYKELIDYTDVAADESGRSRRITIKFKGDATEAREVLNDLMTDVDKAAEDPMLQNAFSGLQKNISQQLASAKEVIETYGDVYEWQKQLALLKDTDLYVSGDDAKTAADWVSELEDAVLSYNEALASGDDGKIISAAAAFNDAKSAVESASDADGNTIFSMYSVQIEDVLEKLNELAIAENDFKKALSGDESVLGKDISHYADDIKQLNLSDVELLSRLQNDGGVDWFQDKYQGLIDAAKELKLISGSTPEDLQKIVGVLVELGVVSSGTAEGVTAVGTSFKDALGSVSENIDNTQSKITTLSGALTSLRDGSMTLEQVIDLIQQFPELAEYVDLTAEGFGDLGEGIEELIRNSPKEVIEELQKLKETEGLTEKQVAAIDGLCDSFEKMSADAIQDASGQFGVLAEAINGAKQAKNELDKALQEEDYDSGYEARVSAFTGMKEVMASGEYGSKAYAAYKEYFGLEGRSAADVQKWMDANSKYFTEGKEGVTAFLNEIESLNKAGKLSEDIAFYDGATGELRYDINYLEEFADSLDWSEEMLQDFIDKYRMYCEDWVERTTEMNQTEFLNAGIIKETSDGAIASLKDLEKYTNYSTEDAIRLIDEINALRASSGMEPIQLIGRDQIHVTQQMVDDLHATLKEAEAVKSVIVDLSKAGATFDSGITYEGQSVENIIANSVDDSGVVSVDIQMNVNGEEVIQTVTTTADTIKGILGEGWEAKINSEDADKRLAATQALANSLVEGEYTVTVGEKTSAASNALSDLIAQLDNISDPRTITVSASVNGGIPDIQSNATGTKNASAGPSLLGDEYSPTGQPKPELVVTKDHAYVAGLNGPEIGYLNDGDVVYTAAQTKDILNGRPDNVKSIMPRYALGKNNIPIYYIDEEAAKRTDGVWSAERSGTNSKNNTLTYYTADGLSKVATTVKKPTVSVSYTTGNAGGKPNLPPLIPQSGDGPGSGGSGSGSGGNSSVKKSFEELYKEHQHLLAMEKETDAEYLAWLEKAYQDAYKSGEIELDDYRKYAEEVYELQKSLFQDSLDDIEHSISILERESGNDQQIINLYLQMIQMVESEMKKAKDRGLDDNSDYIQELQNQYYSYQDAIKEIQDESTEDAKDALEDLIDYRIDMLKQDLENERDALNDKRDALRDFYDDQKEMLQDFYDEEKYLEEQSEKRKTKSDIEAELEQLRFDDSAWAQKRKLELQEQLAEADKELSDFEKDHALENTQDLLDKMYEQQEAQIESEIEAIEEKLNDPEALYNRALKDIQNNTLALYEEMVEYNNRHGSGNPEDIKVMWDEAKASLDRYMSTFGEAYKDIVLVASPGGYASGTRSATPGTKKVDEMGAEWLFTSSNGTRYRVFSGGEKVLNADATDFLYNFATSGGHFLTNVFSDMLRSLNLGSIGKPTQQIQLSTGDVVIQGNTNDRTVSEIRRAQREGIDYVLKEFTRLNR